LNGNFFEAVRLRSCASSLHLLEKLVEWKPCIDTASFSMLVLPSLHLLEKLVEWKPGLFEPEVILTHTLHLLEKLVEWKRALSYFSSASRLNALHLLEKLVEWKPSLVYSLAYGVRLFVLFTCWRN